MTIGSLTQNRIKEYILDWYGSNSAYPVEDAVKIDMYGEDCGVYTVHYAKGIKNETDNGWFKLGEKEIVIKGSRLRYD